MRGRERIPQSPTERDDPARTASIPQPSSPVRTLTDGSCSGAGGRGSVYPLPEARCFGGPTVSYVLDENPVSF